MHLSSLPGETASDRQNAVYEMLDSMVAMCRQGQVRALRGLV